MSSGRSNVLDQLQTAVSGAKTMKEFTDALDEIKTNKHYKNENAILYRSSVIAYFSRVPQSFITSYHDDLPESLFYKLEQLKPLTAGPATWTFPIVEKGLELSPKELGVFTSPFVVQDKEIQVLNGVPTHADSSIVKKIYETIGATYIVQRAPAAVKDAIQIASSLVTFGDGVFMPRTYTKKSGLPGFDSYTLKAQKIASLMADFTEKPVDVTRKDQAQKASGETIFRWLDQVVCSYRAKPQTVTAGVLSGEKKFKREVTLDKEVLFAYHVMQVFCKSVLVVLIGDAKNGYAMTFRTSFVKPTAPVKLLHNGMPFDKYDFSTAMAYLNFMRIVRGQDENTMGEVNKTFYTGYFLPKTYVESMRIMQDVFIPLVEILTFAKHEHNSLLFKVGNSNDLNYLLSMFMICKSQSYFEILSNYVWYVQPIGVYNDQHKLACTKAGVRYNEMPPGAIYVQWVDQPYTFASDRAITGQTGYEEDIRSQFSLQSEVPKIVMSVPVHPKVGGYYYPTPCVHNVRAVWTNLDIAKHQSVVDYEAYYKTSILVNWFRTNFLNYHKNMYELIEIVAGDDKQFDEYECCLSYLTPISSKFGPLLLQKQVSVVEEYYTLDYAINDNEDDEESEEDGGLGEFGDEEPVEDDDGEDGSEDSEQVEDNVVQEPPEEIIKLSPSLPNVKVESVPSTVVSPKKKKVAIISNFH